MRSLQKLQKLLKNSYVRLQNVLKNNHELRKVCVASASVLVLSGFVSWYVLKNKSKPPIFQANAISNRNGTLTPRKTFNFIGNVVQQCAPSVVYIEIKDKKKLDPIHGLPMTISNGSGFVVRSDGLIVTNAHVVINKPTALINVVTQDGKIYEASLVDADLNIDLALLKINSTSDLPSAKLGTAKDLSVGEWVIALGNPLSLNHTATVGVISSASRSAEELGLNNFAMRYIQTDASITFGNSGGPLINLDGDVIGINNLRVTAGISFAIPIDYAKDFIERHDTFKLVRPTYRNMEERCLGIATFTLSPELIKYLLQEHKLIPDDISHGIYVWKVVKNSPADKGGLLVGDIVTHANDLPIRAMNDIYELLTKKDIATLKMNLFRGGKKMVLHVDPTILAT